MLLILSVKLKPPPGGFFYSPPVRSSYSFFSAVSMFINSKSSIENLKHCSNDMLVDGAIQGLLYPLLNSICLNTNSASFSWMEMGCCVFSIRLWPFAVMNVFFLSVADSENGSDVLVVFACSLTRGMAAGKRNTRAMMGKIINMVVLNTLVRSVITFLNAFLVFMGLPGICKIDSFQSYLEYGA